MTIKKPITNFLSAENSACVGCGQIIASRAVVNTLGPDTIVVNATGCLEVTTSQYPISAWKLPWIHSLFANPAPLASGVLAALRYQNKKAKILIQAGDGSTFDIGFGAVSGMWSRHDDIIYVCYDNEVYANTGMQASAATPYGSRTSTTPEGKLLDGHKKDMIAIALAHGLNYVAQTTSGFIDDLKEKVIKASLTKGPSYIQVLSPCIPGWSVGIQDSAKVAQLAATSGLYPGLEFINGKLTKVIKATKPKIKVWDYLQYQSRFRHLPKTKDGLAVLAELQALADSNIKKYGL
jgi:pyruvate ferredoxin oxidoreductase beta subunit